MAVEMPEPRPDLVPERDLADEKREARRAAARPGDTLARSLRSRRRDWSALGGVCDVCGGEVADLRDDGTCEGCARDVAAARNEVIAARRRARRGRAS